MADSVTPAALDYVFEILKVLLTTGLALLTLSVTFLEKIAGRQAYRNVGLWIAWGLLLLSLVGTILCMGYVVNSAANMPTDRVVRFGAGAQADSGDTALEWYDDLSIAAGAVYALWISGVISLVLFVLTEVHLRATAEAKAQHAKDEAALE